MLPLTGERTVPGVSSENYWFQRHVCAYRFARLCAHGRVVDAGSGEGYGTALLRGATGLELDETAVKHAASRYPGCSFVRTDVSALPLRAASVDAIAALQLIEHLTNPDAFISGAARSLRPGGMLIVSTPNRATFPAGQNPFHTHEYDASELEALLRRRFRTVTMKGVEHGTSLRLLDGFLGTSVQEKLVAAPWPEQPDWLRARLRRVRHHDFDITTAPDRSLDLLAVCRDTIDG